MRFEFHNGFQCWALRRYVDVQAALRDPRRFAVSLHQNFDEAGHTRTLRAAMDAFHQRGLEHWLRQLRQIPALAPARELVSQFFEPWAHTAALQLVTLSQDRGDRLRNLARQAFNAAGGADPATAELASLVPLTLGPLTIQAFVATSQTLAAFLSGACAALLEQRAEYPHTPLALEELLRFAGPAQAQFRYLTEDVANLNKGTGVALLLAEANRDPEQFADPQRLDFERSNGGHLAFGGGLHACIGASLIRAAAPIALRRFCDLYQGAELESVEWPRETRPIRSPIAIRIRELASRNPRSNH